MFSFKNITKYNIFLSKRKLAFIFKNYEEFKIIYSILKLKRKKRYALEYKYVSQSKMFDRDWYLFINPDVASSNMDPLEHWIKFGAKEGRDPSMQFSVEVYTYYHPAISIFKINPLLHFELCKDKLNEDMKPIAFEEHLLTHSMLFDKKYYTDVNSKYFDSNKISPVKHYLTEGWKLGLNPSIYFNTNEYIAINKNIIDADTCPLVHYITHKESININVKGAQNYCYIPIPSPAEEVPPNDVIIISKWPQSDGVDTWRNQFLLKELSVNNIRANIEYINNLSEKFFSILYSSKIIFISRPNNDAFYLRLVEYAKKYNKLLLVDIDDLLLPSYHKLDKGGCRSKCIKIDDWVTYVNDSFANVGVTTCQLVADYLVCSTKTLGEVYKEKFKIPTIIRKNVIDYTLFNVNERKLSDDSNLFHIIIASGSDSHNFDFSTIALDLINFMIVHEDVKLTFLGMLESTDFSKLFHNRIRILPKLSYLEMLKEMSKQDLLINPLHRNLFNDCKSNIKFIESAIGGTPALMKNCKEFSILFDKDQDIGFFYDESNFTQKLEYIYNNKKNLKEIGNTAREFVKKYLSINCINNIEFINFIKVLLDD